MKTPDWTYFYYVSYKPKCVYAIACPTLMRKFGNMGRKNIMTNFFVMHIYKDTAICSLGIRNLII